MTAGIQARVLGQACSTTEATSIEWKWRDFLDLRSLQWSSRRNNWRCGTDSVTVLAIIGQGGGGVAESTQQVTDLEELAKACHTPRQEGRIRLVRCPISVLSIAAQGNCRQSWPTLGTADLNTRSANDLLKWLHRARMKKGCSHCKHSFEALGEIIGVA